MHVRPVLIGALMIAAAALGSPAPASAAAASLHLNRSAGLNPDGDFVTASGTGFKPHAQLFVMQCRATSGEDHTCNSIGLQKVTTDAAGNFTSNPLRVVARFGATDCTRIACAIKTSAVADHADDRSQDRAAAISFRANTTTTAAPTTAPPVVTTAPPSTTTAPATTTTATTTTTLADATTTTEATTTTTDAEIAVKDEDAAGTVGIDDDDGGDGSGTVAAVVGGIAVLGAAGVIAAVAVRRRNAADPTDVT